MAGKQSSTRRRSTRTTAPTAPLASSSHMNQNRDWPGGPNRYRISWSSTVMRPKSMAPAGVVLWGARGAEQVQGRLVVEGDAAEVHGHRRGRLVGDRGGVVDPHRHGGHVLFGGQRRDLPHRPHEGGLAGG